MKRWECTVCGYIHEGPEPPETCPVCGADRDKFIELPPEKISAPESVAKEVTTPAPQNRWKALYYWTIRQMTKQHAHPISVHIPNGVLPVAVVFLLLSLFLESTALADASFYNMLFVALVMPFVLFSGYNDWKRLFEGNMSRLFLTKMICGAILAISAPLVVVWKIVNPDVLSPSAASRPLYVIIHMVMFAAAVLAGFLGGKLVIFRGVDKE